MAERVRLTIDGQPALAEKGGSLLAALWNAGLRRVRTSVTGEGRGPLCGMGTCHECRVTVDGDPYRRACLEAVREGMTVQLSPAAVDLPFPEAATPVAPGPETGPSGLSAEVVVVGAGPAGAAAAVHAAGAGRQTLLLDEQARPGGQVWRGETPPLAREWIARLARSGATVVGGASVVDAPASNELLVERDGRPVRVSFERLVLATGARELFLPFPGWTLPGVVGVGGAQALLKAGARLGGRRVVVAGTGPLLLAVATALREAGARIEGVAEQAPAFRVAAFGAALLARPRTLAEGLGYAWRLAGTRWRTGAWVREVLGRDGVERVVMADAGGSWEWECDVLACGFGLVPNLELPRLLGCETTAAGVVVDPTQQTSRPGIYAAGELVGIAGVEQALATGAIAGLAAAGRPAPRELRSRRHREKRFGERLARAFALRPELRGLARADTLVCRCEDVPLGSLDPAASAREAKLLTRAGMGPCQGRVCGPAVAWLRGWEHGSVRAPIVPVPVSVLAPAEPPAPSRPGAGAAPGPARGTASGRRRRGGGAGRRSA